MSEVQSLLEKLTQELSANSHIIFVDIRVKNWFTDGTRDGEMFPKYNQHCSIFLSPKKTILDPKRLNRLFIGKEHWIELSQSVLKNIAVEPVRFVSAMKVEEGYKPGFVEYKEQLIEDGSNKSLVEDAHFNSRSRPLGSMGDMRSLRTRGIWVRYFPNEKMARLASRGALDSGLISREHYEAYKSNQTVKTVTTITYPGVRITNEIED